MQICRVFFFQIKFWRTIIFIYHLIFKYTHFDYVELLYCAFCSNCILIILHIFLLNRKLVNILINLIVFFFLFLNVTNLFNFKCLFLTFEISWLCVILIYIFTLHIVLHAACMIDVAQERLHSDILKGVETFKPSTLKRTDTQEKIVLPKPEGKM